MHLDHSLLHPALTANVVSFARLLREHGVAVGPDEQSDALRALQAVDLADLADFRLSLRLALAKRPQDQEAFDALFFDFWTKLLVQPARLPDATVARERPISRPGGKTAPLSIKHWLEGAAAQQEERERMRYSPYEVITRKDFRHLQGDELQEITRVIQAMVRPLVTRYARRLRRAPQARRLDLRGTIRLNLRRGGDLVDLAFRERRREHPRLVLLCDVSQSMDRYTAFLIQFAYAFQRVYRRIETFVFGTSLHRLTPLFKGRVLRDVLATLPDEVPGWGGGTRIGASLDAFRTDYGDLLTSKTTVLILSDGWDTGELDLLAESMKAIHRSAGRVIWLNPLMGNPGFEPTAGGMAAALPYIDVLASAHNVESLRQTVRHLVWKR